LLLPAQADALLPALRCQQCRGQFVRGEHYFAWLDRRDRAAAEGPSPQPTAASFAAAATTHDDSARRALLCPDCGRLMTRYRVGHGTAFHLDRCAACGGIWFDAAEFETLRALALHDQVHFVFSAAWQADVAREQQVRAARDRLHARLGDADLAQLERLTEWLDAHPHRAELIAYLLDHFQHAATTR
jgi:Zn-finger nucleic acid-binding protein